MSRGTICVGAFVLVILATPVLGVAIRPSVPQDAIQGILDAFRSHRVVALGEGRHGAIQPYEFRLSLIRDPRFATVVNDIVVESGNALYQNVMDRFIRGENVPQDELRHAWQDTLQTSAVWDATIYEQFFRDVSKVNRTLPPTRQLRVLLGDQPMDWSGVRTHADYERRVPKRSNEFTIDLIKREVVRKGRRALVVYGEGHLHRSYAGSIVGGLEASGTRVYTILTAALGDATRIEPQIAAWRPPVLTVLRGTPLGAVDRDFWVGGPGQVTRPVPTERDFDALLYLGPPSSMTLAPFGAALCGDSAYLATRLARIENAQEAQSVRQACEQQHRQ